jgi:hypothetical protein
MMTDVVDKLPPNMEKVLMTNAITWGFAYIKDGMYQWDDSKEWYPFVRDERGLKWITITELKKLLGVGIANEIQSKPELMTKYFNGWINLESMDVSNWVDTWFGQAKKAESEGCELVVFKIPKNKNGVMSKDLISQIERMLQENKKINQ